jgi:hypothetical protein
VSLRRDGMSTKVVCDGCEAEHRTAERLPALAFYDATLKHGWKPYTAIESSLRRGRLGVFCPACVEGMSS